MDFRMAVEIVLGNYQVDDSLSMMAMPSLLGSNSKLDRQKHRYLIFADVNKTKPLPEVFGGCLLEVIIHSESQDQNDKGQSRRTRGSV